MKMNYYNLTCIFCLTASGTCKLVGVTLNIIFTIMIVLLVNTFSPLENKHLPLK